MKGRTLPFTPYNTFRYNTRVFPNWHLDLGVWDGVLIAAVSTMALLAAYLRHPKWKALMITLPVPFTVSALALGRPIDITNVAALGLLLLFYVAVRGLHLKAHWPIIPSIITGALGYAGVGALLAPKLPHSPQAFWVASGVAFLLGAGLWALLPYRVEPGHREEMPVWAKGLLVVLITGLLVVVKKNLQGFMTLFPMVGVFAAYEGRHCLWTLLRQIPVMILIMLPVLITSRLLEPTLGLGFSLGIGWVVFFGMLGLTTLIRRRMREG